MDETTQPEKKKTKYIANSNPSLMKKRLTHIVSEEILALVQDSANGKRFEVTELERLTKVVLLLEDVEERRDKKAEELADSLDRIKRP